MNIDSSKISFNKIKNTISNNINLIETEEDSRVQIINRILTETLGWEFRDIKTEKHIEKGYIDYLLNTKGRNRLIIEAKRKDKLLIDTSNPKLGNYKIDGPALKSASEGICQAINYCSKTGVPFAVLTTGFEWIAFIANRTDGISPLEGKAITFPSLEVIENNYALFYDLFSKEGLLEKRFRGRIYEAEGLQIHHAEKLHQSIKSHEIKLLPKSPLAHDIDTIFSNFFSTMSGQSDSEMLAKCFVESKESREADSTLEKIMNNLINNIEIVSPNQGEQLQEELKSAVEIHKGEFVLIIGNKGAGKSTFIERFFKLILDRKIKSKCLILRIDLAKSNGDINHITNWLTNQLKNELETQLFKNSNPTYDELQGVFYQEYRRWKEGTYQYLYTKDKTEFKIKFGEHLNKIITEDPSKYSLYLLEDAVRTRKLMPCIVFDNTDHFPQDFQEKVFQFAQHYFTQIFTFIICPITDKTVWQLSKSGPLQSYNSRAFYLPIPSTKEILQKRVNFIKEKISEETTKQNQGNYFLEKGIRISINDLNAFTACIEEILINTDYISRIIGWLSNHDIRRSLNISQRIVTSPIISIDDLVKAYLSNNEISIPRENIIKALIFGNYSSFFQEYSELILNLFQINPDQITTPLLKPSILRLLIDIDNQSPSNDKSYISIEEVQEYFESAGISSTITSNHIKEILKYRLAAPYDPTDDSINNSLRIKITHCGKIHHEFILSKRLYVVQMALSTPVRDYDLTLKIREVIQQNTKLTKDDWNKIASEFMNYCINQDKVFTNFPLLPIYDGQNKLRQELRSKWIHQHS